MIPADNLSAGIIYSTLHLKRAESLVELLYKSARYNLLITNKK